MLTQKDEIVGGSNPLHRTSSVRANAPEYKCLSAVVRQVSEDTPEEDRKGSDVKGGACKVS